MASAQPGAQPAGADEADPNHRASPAQAFEARLYQVPERESLEGVFSA